MFRTIVEFLPLFEISCPITNVWNIWGRFFYVYTIYVLANPHPWVTMVTINELRQFKPDYLRSDLSLTNRTLFLACYGNSGRNLGWSWRSTKNTITVRPWFIGEYLITQLFWVVTNFSFASASVCNLTETQIKCFLYVLQNAAKKTVNSNYQI